MRKRLQSSVQGVIVCLIVVVNPLDAFAQSASTGALTGVVTDPSSAVVQNAKITLRNHGTAETLEAVTGQDGSYRFSLLPPGEYDLTVEALGFAPVVVHEVMIRITEVRSVATSLTVSGAKEEVVVSRRHCCRPTTSLSER